MDEDPPRWIDRPAGEQEEDRAAERLRGARELALSARAPGHVRHLTHRRTPGPLFAVARFAAVLIAGMGIGVAGASSAWLARARSSARPPAPRPDRLDVAAGATARLHRAGCWRMALAGPATVTAGDGEACAVRVSGGTLTLAADAAPVSIEAGLARFRLAPGAAAQVDVADDGTGQALALVGHVEGSTPRAATRDATEGERALALGVLDGQPAPEPAVTAPPALTAALEVAAPRAVTAPSERARATEVAPDPQATVRAPAAAPAPAPAGVAPSAWPAPALAGSSDSEAAWLSRALASLRKEGDPVAALAVLDQHDARFPTGALRAEAVALRIEALLARHDETGALAWLDALPAPRVPLDRPLQVSRGELRAKTGRCAEAVADFSAALHATAWDAVDERALRGRAACAAYARDEAALQADLERYLQRFADRPFADEARSRLAKMRPAP